MVIIRLDLTAIDVCRSSTIGLFVEETRRTRILVKVRERTIRMALETLSFSALACECHDHADRCVYDEAKGVGVCVDCKHNTTGDWCDSCLPNFFRDPTTSLKDLQVSIGGFSELDKRCTVRCTRPSFLFTECSNCDGFGTKACNASNCICHPNVEGDFCRNCTCGFGKIQDAVAGCECKRQGGEIMLKFFFHFI